VGNLFKVDWVILPFSAELGQEMQTNNTKLQAETSKLQN
jgi:hypothetical protein